MNARCVYLIDEDYYIQHENIRKFTAMRVSQLGAEFSLTAQFSSEQHLRSFLPDPSAIAAVIVAVRGKETESSLEFLEMINNRKVCIPVLGFLPSDSVLQDHFKFVSLDKGLVRNRKQHLIYTPSRLRQFNQGVILGDVVSALNRLAHILKN